MCVYRKLLTMKQKGNLVKSLLCTEIENMGRKPWNSAQIYGFCIPLYFAMQWKSKVAFIHIQLSKFQIWPIPGLSGLLNLNCRRFPIQLISKDPNQRKNCKILILLSSGLWFGLHNLWWSHSILLRSLIST